MKDIFSTQTNTYLISPRLKELEKSFIGNWKSRNLESHVFLLSSGTTSKNEFKSFAISKRAILSSAKAVNDRFAIGPQDRWLSSLPIYHIGGLSIYARSSLSESEVIEYNEKWSPLKLAKIIKKEKINYLSLVPTQLYDLIINNVEAPDCLKGVFLGGDFASRALCEKGAALGWPLLITYGMTELSSQIATTKFNNMQDGFLEVYDIHKLSTVNTDIQIDSPSLFTEKISMNSRSITMIESSKDFKLLDELELKTIDGVTFLKPLGRRDDVFKLSGRLFHLNTIIDSLSGSFLESGFTHQIHITLSNDERLGRVITVNCLETLRTHQKSIEKMIEKSLSIPLRFFRFQFFESFSKTELGKIRKID